MDRIGGCHTGVGHRMTVRDAGNGGDRGVVSLVRHSGKYPSFPASLTVIPAQAGNYKAGIERQTVILALRQYPQGGATGHAQTVIADLIRNPVGR